MRAKTYQKPKADHPWRQYPDRVLEVEVEIQDTIPIKEFLEGLLKNWDNVEITTKLPRMGYRRYTLPELPQNKVAAWLAGVLKRNYVQPNRYEKS